MCRLVASTDTKHAEAVRRMVFHQLMLYSQADGNQYNGSGVTDGVTGRKSPFPYADFGIDWLQHLAPNAIWHGHVRRASRDTSLSTNEAHPFYFRLHDGSRLFASHNGGVYGFNARINGDPDVDSFRAFKELVRLLDNAKSETITTEIVNQWIDKFDVGSEWTFMLTHKGLLHILRGNREMYAASFGNGYLFNTSKTVLMNLANWAATFWGEPFTIGEARAIEPWTYVTAAPGKRKLHLENIHEQKQPPLYQRMYTVMADNGTTNIVI